MYINTKIILKLSEIVSKVMKKDQNNGVVSSQYDGISSHYNKLRPAFK